MSANDVETWIEPKSYAYGLTGSAVILTIVKGDTYGSSSNI
jgi:hypothetical protein